MKVGDNVRVSDGTGLPDFTGTIIEQGKYPYEGFWKVKLDEPVAGIDGNDTWCFDYELTVL